MRKLRLQAFENWRVILVGALAAAVCIFLYLFQLATLPGGLDTQEHSIGQMVLQDRITPIDLLRDAVWLPYQLFIFVLQYLPHSDWLPWLLRLGSAIVALAAIWSLYLLLKWWHSTRVAILGAGIFACGTWLLHAGRYASPEVLYLLPLILLASWAAVQQGKRILGLLIAGVTGAMCLYVPGLVWFLLPALIWQRRFLIRQLQAIAPIYMIATIVLTVLALAPLLVTILLPNQSSSTVEALRAFAGLPQSFPNPTEIARNLVHTLSDIFLRSDANPVYFVGHAPLLSFFLSAAFLTGLYETIRYIKLDRSKIFLIWLGIGLALVALRGVSIHILLPVIYLIAIAGIRYLLVEWLTVFPRNPLARGIGIALISFAIAITCLYHLSAYFNAWPHTPGVKSTFTRQL